MGADSVVILYQPQRQTSNRQMVGELCRTNPVKTIIYKPIAKSHTNLSVEAARCDSLHTACNLDVATQKIPFNLLWVVVVLLVIAIVLKKIL